MSFVVDGSEWQFDGCSEEEVHESIETILALVHDLLTLREKVWIGDDFQSRPMLNNLALWSMFSPDSPIMLSAELRQELAAWLGTVSYYSEEDVWPAGFEDFKISIDGEPATENADVAWAHHSVRSRTPVGCLSFRRSGALSTTTVAGSADIFFVKTRSNRLDFWRDAIRLRGDNEATFQSISPHAYPDLYFHENVLANVARLAGGYLALRNEIQRSLAVLNDYGHWSFTFPGPSLRPEDTEGADQIAPVTNHLIERRFRAHGLVVSPENPNVYLNLDCRHAREVQVDDELLYCGWHVKLEPNRNRIYLHRPVDSASDRVVVAIIHEHLPLP